MVGNKWFGIFIPVILLMTIITPIAHADYININIDVSGIINAVTSGPNQQTQTSNNNTSTLNNSLMGIPQALFGVFTTSAKNSITQVNTQLLSLTQELLSANPNPELMYGWWQAITLIISSFYVLIFLYIGFNFLINSHSVVKREQNKEHLKNAIIMIIGINISFYLYKLILELSTGITKFMWMTGFETFFDNNIFSGIGLIMLMIFCGTTLMALLTLFFRYLFLMIGVVIFPIGIFLRLTPNLENWGRMIFNFLGIILAIQFIDIVILIATQQAMNQLAGTIGSAFVIPLGFIAIAIINMIMIFYAIIKSAFSITQQAPILNLALSTITGNIGSAVGSVQKMAVN